ncbi:HAMP domain-containing sensor histidine kinase [Saccharopolyspora phatthalungensis]|uniref:histidine kinase n=1 Tax=Saccharopolyspora phatthalungensis TaxID=664693 RepID=A0A840Q7G2_9PSEU|nr:HAMP domain-containing sensor histidine kinase [Saccharopolyspora phatthalungensis]MBB5158452.1 two-component system sensor histidine kinase UhpB [Saccharopolyspora phatthalungensis]
MSLFWRLLLLNAAVLVAGAAALLLGPATVSAPFFVAEALILAIGLAVMLVVNAILLRIGLAPLERLARVMTTIDPLRPGARLAVTGHGETADLIKTFNTMLDRLEDERATSSAVALSAQEAERHRIAQELHDEVGQTLTAVLLELKRVADQAPETVATALHQVQETTRDSLDEIRRIARRLRPGVLEELGLVSALKALTTEVPPRTGLIARCHLDSDLPDLGDATELVLYRVAQESLTNTVRHARATRVELSLRSGPTGVELSIRDNGGGLGSAPEGAGIRGMRERALLIGARLTLGPGARGGTEVRLHVPTATKAPEHV